jgi:hypothetical protein
MNEDVARAAPRAFGKAPRAYRTVVSSVEGRNVVETQNEKLALHQIVENGGLYFTFERILRRNAVRFILL